MSAISLFIKIVGCLVGVTGILATLNAYSDDLLLYKPERDAIASETVVIEAAKSSNADIAIVKIKEGDESWSCTIKAELFPLSQEELNIPESFRTEFVTKIKQRLPVSGDSESSNVKQKQVDKNQLVRNCSLDRSWEPLSKSVKSNISLVVVKNEGSESYSIKDDSLDDLFW